MNDESQKNYTNKQIRVINKRREEISEIKQQYKDKGQKLTRLLLQEELDKRGYKNVSLGTIDRDLIEVAKGDNFVRNISEATYSQDMHRLFDSLDVMEEKCWEWLNNPPQILKQELEPNPADPAKPIVTKSIIETISPVVLIREIRELVKAKLDFYSGDVLRLSIAMIGEKFQLMEQQVAEAQRLTPLIPKGRPVRLKIKNHVN